MTTFDIYNIIASVAIVVLTILGTIALYYLIIILKRVREGMDSLDEGVAHTVECMKELAAKASNLSTYASAIMQGVKMVSAFKEERTEKKRKRELKK